MPSVDPRIDAYIEKSADFAKPVLTHIRMLVHKAFPDIRETMKWSFPHFDHKGTVCSMASFKQHCAFGFWKQSLLEQGAFPAEKTAMGSFGRITSVKDLPSDKVMTSLIRQAVELNEKGIKIAKKKPVEKKELVVPKDLASALSKNKSAKAAFEKFSYSHKKEYVQWIEEAKTEPTRNKRLATTVEWLSEGKSRNWKYENC
ncbi:MAG TPA: YdeI/OmpD-associated family protein [Pyrinomonadaceae bacterium]|nr:YdeI/OmpD-associated family protein [Pyrinomonadaceae bacterium]